MNVSGRSLIRQGFIILLVAFFTGFGIVAGGPQARAWMGVHVTAMLSAVFAVLIGLSWDTFSLSRRQRGVLYGAVVANGYWGLIAGAFAVVFAVPGPVSGGGAQPAGPSATIFFSVFIPVLTILPFVFSGLVIYGLRGDSAKVDAKLSSAA